MTTQVGRLAQIDGDVGEIESDGRRTLVYARDLRAAGIKAVAGTPVIFRVGAHPNGITAAVGLEPLHVPATVGELAAGVRGEMDEFTRLVREVRQREDALKEAEPALAKREREVAARESALVSAGTQNDAQAADLQTRAKALDEREADLRVRQVALDGSIAELQRLATAKKS